MITRIGSTVNRTGTTVPRITHFFSMLMVLGISLLKKTRHLHDLISNFDL